MQGSFCHMFIMWLVANLGQLPKANHTGTSRRKNENFIIWAGSPTYPSPGGVQASPLLGASYTTPFVSLNVLVQLPNSPVVLRRVATQLSWPFEGLQLRV